MAQRWGPYLVGNCQPVSAGEDVKITDNPKRVILTDSLYLRDAHCQSGNDPLHHRLESADICIRNSSREQHWTDGGQS